MDVKEFVLGFVADGDVVAATLQGAEKHVCVFAVGDCRYLYESGYAGSSCGDWVERGLQDGFAGRGR